MPFANYNAYLNITAATAGTVVKAGPGQLFAINLQNMAIGSVLTVFDNTAASGTKIATYTQGAAALVSPVTLFYDLKFNIGLTIVTTNTNDITVTFA
jgi:hypothetical protein